MPSKAIQSPSFMKEYKGLLNQYNSRVPTKQILQSFSENEFEVLTKTLRYYCRANQLIPKKYEKQYIVTILKLTGLLMKGGQVGGFPNEMIEYESDDEYDGDYQVGEYRGRKNRLGQLLLVMTVAIVVYLYWMLFQQIKDDVISLENSLQQIDQSPERIIDIISDGVDSFFKEVGQKVSQSNIDMSGLEEPMTMKEFEKVTPLNLPLAIGSGNDLAIVKNEDVGMDKMTELINNMSQQFKHLIALKSGVVQCIYEGWAANGQEGKALAQFSMGATKKFIQSSTQIANQVIEQKSDKMEAFTTKYMGNLQKSLTEAQKKDTLVDLLSTFAGAQVAINARERILSEFESIMTNELMYFISNTDTQVKNRVMTDMRIVLDRIKRTTQSIYNTLRCIQRVSYVVLILPILNHFKDRIGEKVGEQLGIGDRVMYLEDKRANQGKKSTRKKKKSTKKTKKKKSTKYRK